MPKKLDLINRIVKLEDKVQKTRGRKIGILSPLSPMFGVKKKLKWLNPPMKEHAFISGIYMVYLVI